MYNEILTNNFILIFKSDLLCDCFIKIAKTL